MKYGTLFSGIEAPSVAWKDLGWKACWFSEIADFPSAVLKKRYPEVTNLGDIERVNWDEQEKTNLIIGGSPCQAFSISGLRQGLDDPRGNLALVFLRAISKVKPKWIIWENVPGVLSSNKGRDFGAFISALSELGYGFCWRVLDSQFWAVPQRRKRVYLVGYFGNWQYPAAVLFDKKSMQRPTPKSRKKGQAIADHIMACPGDDSTKNKLLAMASAQANAEILEELCPTLTCLHEVPIIFDPAQITSKDNHANPQPGDPCTTMHAYCQPLLAHKYNLRRITPIEAERLQGFPDNYTQIPYKGKTKENCPISHRYTALGNSMAVPVVRWIGNRINFMDSVISTIS